MAYTYLIDLHQFLGKRLEEAKSVVNGKDTDPEDQRFHEGRIHLLLEFQDFLSQNFR